MDLSPLNIATPYIRLAPLTQADRADLRHAAGESDAIWQFWLFDVPRHGFDGWFDYLLAGQAAGVWMPHTVRLPDGRAVGQTCYLTIRPENDGVEIGGTWYAPSVQGTQVNPACKLAMLGHAFACGAHRVELKTDNLNARSQAAMLKMGAKFDGTLRQHGKRPDGSYRETVFYSVLRDEWPLVKAGLEARLLT
jgi:RimJ/RimL family protein N-acetyltransferase